MQETKCVDVSFAREDRTILRNINLTIPTGKITAIMGPSGCGKTTLLRLLVGLLKPTKGQVFLLGQDLARINQTQLFQLRRHIGMLFQNAALFTDMTVFDNVAFPLREKTTFSAQKIQEIVMQKLAAVDLQESAQRLPNELSGGMARRAALARAVALEPQILFYDEPFTGQDPISKNGLVNLIKSLNHALKATTVLVSHDVPETMALADYVYLIADGTVVAEGAPDSLMKMQQTSWVKQFLTGQQDEAHHEDATY